MNAFSEGVGRKSLVGRYRFLLGDAVAATSDKRREQLIEPAFELIDCGWRGADERPTPIFRVVGFNEMAALYQQRDPAQRGRSRHAARVAKV